jgi:hypothetical protein
VSEQLEHGQVPQIQAYFIQTTRDTLENWHSEFLQLTWQGNDRLEEKVDLIVQALDKDRKKEIAKLDRAYLRD